jgi:hypothetical protein
MKRLVLAATAFTLITTAAQAANIDGYMAMITYDKVCEKLPGTLSTRIIEQAAATFTLDDLKASGARVQAKIQTVGIAAFCAGLKPTMQTMR